MTEPATAAASTVALCASAAVAAAVTANARNGNSGLHASAAAAAAAAGGLGGYLIWRASSTKGERPHVSTAAVLRALDEAHHSRIRHDEDALGNLGYCEEVEQWIFEMWGGEDVVSPALRIAARGLRLNDEATVPRMSFEPGDKGYFEWRKAGAAANPRQLRAFLEKMGVTEVIIKRVMNLLGAELTVPAAGAASTVRVLDVEVQTLEDAIGLVFLKHELPYAAKAMKEDSQLVDLLLKEWKKLGRPAQARALAIDYSPRVLGCLVQAIATAEGLVDSGQTPMVAPRLPRKTVSTIRQSWANVPKDAFGSDFLQKAFAEDNTLAPVLDFEVCRADNLWKVIQVLVDLLDSAHMPQFERIIRSIAALSHEFGRLRAVHLAPLRRALLRTILGYCSKDKKKVNRVWEAFFYSMMAVAAPDMVLRSSIPECSDATATALPIPCASSYAGALAAHGIGLMEMCLNVSATSAGGQQCPPEVAAKLFDARNWLVDAVRSDVNAYCGLLATVYGNDPGAGPGEDIQIGEGKISAEETERRLWNRRATEVPLRMAEVSMGTAIACLPCCKQVKASLQPDWIAGSKLLRTAMEISLKSVSVNILGVPRGGTDLEQRRARLLDTESPWKDLCNF
eukprot:TRINITY_DN20757_c0_g1_i1.p1 TRINITY_DN20757_c0_g1~~TRINITY_DN20757_c0_g1_i1.p1  ORF type:complete len:646 (-),score=158.59 TRINITY_DN20757_c0_g1_i1:202-2073(-)